MKQKEANENRQKGDTPRQYNAEEARTDGNKACLSYISEYTTVAGTRDMLVPIQSPSFP